MAAPGARSSRARGRRGRRGGRARGDAGRDGLLPRPPRRGERLGGAEGPAPALRRRACRSPWRPSLPLADVQDALLAAIRFRAYPEVPAVLERLRAGGARLAVVSNWDVSLHDVLERTGLRAARRRASSSRPSSASPSPIRRSSAPRSSGWGPTPPRRSTSATAWSTTSPARARRAWRRCSSPATARRRPTACVSWRRSTACS